jgi:hypothetical protein
MITDPNAPAITRAGRCNRSAAVDRGAKRRRRSTTTSNLPDKP